MYSVKTIAKSIDAEVLGSSERMIREPVQIQPGNLREDTIMWCKKANIHLLKEIKHGAIICEQAMPDYFQPDCSYLIVDNARRSFQKVLQHFFQRPEPCGISASAIIGSNVSLGNNVYVGHHVVIEDDCIIGDNCRIDHNTVIKSGTVVGENVCIGCNTSIGGDGYGYERNEEGNFDLIPHIGNVIIGDNAGIGNNVTIDRALMGSTMIGAYSKIDNLVYIAHGVTIGRNCLVIGCAMISGSTEVGDNTWISPNATLINKISVGTGSVIGIGSVVLKDVPEKTTVAGNPARIIVTAK